MTADRVIELSEMPPATLALLAHGYETQAEELREALWRIISNPNSRIGGEIRAETVALLARYPERK